MPTLEAVMTTREVADRLSQLFKEFKWKEALEELFSQDAVSVEPAHSPGLQTVQGLDNIKKKGDQFNEMVEEMHGGSVGEPIVGGNYIAVSMSMDVTMKGSGRMNMEEICLYEVKDGKIVKEQFFY
jgi:ketosteroid isomerase-like protein